VVVVLEIVPPIDVQLVPLVERCNLYDVAPLAVQEIVMLVGVGVIGEITGGTQSVLGDSVADGAEVEEDTR